MSNHRQSSAFNAEQFCEGGLCCEELHLSQPFTGSSFKGWGLRALHYETPHAKKSPQLITNLEGSDI